MTAEKIEPPAIRSSNKFSNTDPKNQDAVMESMDDIRDMQQNHSPNVIVDENYRRALGSMDIDQNLIPSCG